MNEAQIYCRMWQKYSPIEVRNSPIEVRNSPMNYIVKVALKNVD